MRSARAFAFYATRRRSPKTFFEGFSRRSKAKCGLKASASASGWTRARRSRTALGVRASVDAPRRASPETRRARKPRASVRAPPSPSLFSARVLAGGAPWPPRCARATRPATRSAGAWWSCTMRSGTGPATPATSARASGARRTAASAGEAKPSRRRPPIPTKRARTWKSCPRGPGRSRQGTSPPRRETETRRPETRPARSARAAATRAPDGRRRRATAARGRAPPG
mmetsp:Transcript_15525/g.65488  ORF Transcript_15525/g.65488 Transcript_15525/m.65488 type:complete len:227 (+) Transcript_15525:946-1626(+)